MCSPVLGVSGKGEGEAGKGHGPEVLLQETEEWQLRNGVWQPGSDREETLKAVSRFI